MDKIITQQTREGHKTEKDKVIGSLKERISQGSYIISGKMIEEIASSFAKIFNEID